VLTGIGELEKRRDSCVSLCPLVVRLKQLSLPTVGRELVAFNSAATDCTGFFMRCSILLSGLAERGKAGAVRCRTSYL